MFKLTDEQDGIVKATPNPGKSMIVTAFAGTGKTFTLERYAEARPRDRILYAAFNKAIQLEAERKMPTNVMARTTHSLAYRAIGAKYQKEGKLQSNVPVWRISTYLGTSNIVMANFVLTVVKQFLASADAQILDTHIPQNVIDYYVKENKPMPPLVDMARGVWDSMSDFTPNSLPMVHDGYLKLYQLSGPVLDFDYILLDEAQDTTPCVWDIMVNQKGRKIVVGDPHQAIYCQPVGTMVDVPSEVEDVPVEKQCSFDGCTRRRDHKDSSLCDQHEKQRIYSGGELTPIKRTPKKVHIKSVPIESLNEGDHVVTYSNSHVYKRGRPVKSVTKYPYIGRMIKVETGCGRESFYIPRHHCVVRVGDSFKGKHIVYMMRKDTRFRIGRVPFFYGSQGNTFGLAARSTQERVDCAWILSVHDTSTEANIAEHVYQYKFGIPGIRFRSSPSDVMSVHKFWAKWGCRSDEFEDTRIKKAMKCLYHFGRDIDFPLWTRGNKQGTLIGVRRPFVTAATNLMDGMLVLTAGSEKKYNGKRDYVAPKDSWTPITVFPEHFYEGEIVSLEVEDHHNYYGDGILTHNSWRGAIDAMALVSDAETFYLTQSFRFGPKVAALASTLLRRFKKEEKPLRGLESLDTEVSIEAPSGTRTVLARGNNLIFRSSAYEVENTKRNLGYVGGDHTNYRFQTYLDAFNLYSDKKDWIKDPVIKSFETFDELKEYADNVQSLELQGACVMVEEYKGRIPIIMRKVKERDVGAKYADLAYATGHKSKGLEFPVVQLANDFEVAIDAHLEMSGVVPDEELNLLYVAITRGTETLFIPSAVKTWIECGSTKPRPVQKKLFDDKPGQVKQGEREIGMTMSKGDFLSRLLSSSPKGDGARDAVPERVKKFWE